MNPLRRKRVLDALIVVTFLILMAAVIYTIREGRAPYDPVVLRQKIEHIGKDDARREGRSAVYDVTPLIDDEYADALIADIRRAKTSIDVLMFEFKITRDPNNPADRLAGELIAARRRGVKVKVRLEQSDHDIKLTKINRETAEYLKRHGIYPEFDPRDVETHSKAVLIDGTVLYVGNHNWSLKALRDNREVSFRIESEKPLSVMRFFFDDFDAMMNVRRMGGS